MKTKYLNTSELEEIAFWLLGSFEVACKWPDLSSARDIAADCGHEWLTVAQYRTAMQMAKAGWEARKVGVKRELANA